MLKKANVIWHAHKLKRIERQKIKKHKSFVLWLTGIPSSGKSTVANKLEYILNKNAIHTYVLDGDNIRHGLNKDLGFSRADREENIRRIGEVSKLFVDAGVVAITAFISPFKKDRNNARKLFKKGEFIEIYVGAPLQMCIKRDPKGFYKKAIAGKIKNFTGISGPYEKPESPEIALDTDKLSIKESVDKILKYLKKKKLLNL